MRMIIHDLHMFVFYILIVNIFPRDIRPWGGHFGTLVATQLSFPEGFVTNCRNKTL